MLIFSHIFGNFRHFGIGLTAIILLGLLSACDSHRVYEKNIDIANRKWIYEDLIRHEIDITDTTRLYNLYINVRHTFHYTYSNLWVIVYTTFPDGTRLHQRLEILLSDKTGKWHGKCLGDICDIQLPIQQNAFFDQPGKYVFEIEQNMRESPIVNIMSIGLRLEDTGKNRPTEASGSKTE